MQNSSLYERVVECTPDQPITLRLQTRSNANIAACWHEHIELLYFISGTCRITCGSHTFTAGKGDLIFLNSNEIHFTEQSFTSDLWCMHIHPSLVKDTPLEKNLLENFIPNDEVVIRLFENILRAYMQNTVGRDMAIKGYTYVLLSYLLQHYTGNETIAESLYEREARLQQIRPVIHYISQHYTEKLSIAELAGLLYMSEHHFCKLFKSAVGQTVVSYINSVRIEKATVLLQNTSESLTTIAELTGFHDLNYFSRTFERILQMRPSQYRKLLSTK